jgi:hypothetical protein
LDKLKSILDIDFSAISQNIIQEEYVTNSPTEIDSQKIKFAWETPKKEIHDIAIKKIEASKNIVVIGYTFPLYNRLADLNYFNQESLRETRIYFQDPNAEIIAENVQDSFDIRTARVIKPIKDCSNFFIPSDIFDSSVDKHNTSTDINFSEDYN